MTASCYSGSLQCQHIASQHIYFRERSELSPRARFLYNLLGLRGGYDLNRDKRQEKLLLLFRAKASHDVACRERTYRNYIRLINQTN